MAKQYRDLAGRVGAKRRIETGGQTQQQRAMLVHPDGMIAAYILRCGDGSYYVGSARNLNHRMMQHHSGHGAAYTSTRMPIQLVWYEEFDRIDEAYAREKQVQGWSRVKREALIEGRILDLTALAKKHFA